MPKENLITVTGKVINEAGGGIYTIDLGDGKTMRAKISNTMRHHKIMVLVGDTVDVGTSPYDLSHGLITRRLRGQ